MPMVIFMCSLSEARRKPTARSCIRTTLQVRYGRRIWRRVCLFYARNAGPQSRNRSVTVVVGTQGSDVQSGVGVDEVKTHACMVAQGWQQAPPSISGIVPL